MSLTTVKRDGPVAVMARPVGRHQWRYWAACSDCNTRSAESRHRHDAEDWFHAHTHQEDP